MAAGSHLTNATAAWAPRLAPHPESSPPSPIRTRNLSQFSYQNSTSLAALTSQQ
jgi:hypothetical protein